MSANIENSSSGDVQATPAEASADTTVSGAVAEPQDGACAPGTLHDFVSSLINDEAAKAAYLADPLGALGAAGLGDLSPADVQDALPLVADALPTDLAGGLPGLGDLPLDLPTGLPSLPDLDSLTGALPVDGLTGALPVDGLTDALPVDGLPSVDGLTGALDAGGLSAVTGLASTLPVDGLTGALPVDGLTGALPVDGLTGALPVDGLTGAVDGVTGALPVDSLTSGLPSPGDLPVVGDLPVSLPNGVPSLSDLPGLDDVAGVLPTDLGDVASVLPTDGLPALDNLPIADLPEIPTLETPLGDVTAVVDGATGLAGLAVNGDLVESATSGVVEGAEGLSLASNSDSALGGLAGEAKLGPELGGAVAGVAPLVDFAGNLGQANDGDLHVWGGSNTPFGHTAVHADAGPDGAGIAAVSPLGDLAANTAGDFTIQPADTSDLLDVDNIGSTGDAVIGTVAHTVSTGSSVLADGVESGTANLGGFLTGTPLAPVADVVDTAADTVGNGIEQGGDTVAANVPSVDSIGVVDSLPQLPQLPDLPDVSSSDLPDVGDVTSHLPVSLPQVQLPDTSAVTDLVSNNPVTDVVHQSPVGGLVDGVTGHLPQVGDHLPVVGDLDLGL